MSIQSDTTAEFENTVGFYENGQKINITEFEDQYKIAGSIAQHGWIISIKSKKYLVQSKYFDTKATPQYKINLININNKNTEHEHQLKRARDLVNPQTKKMLPPPSTHPEKHEENTSATDFFVDAATAFGFSYSNTAIPKYLNVNDTGIFYLPLQPPATYKVTLIEYYEFSATSFNIKYYVEKLTI